MAGVPIYTRVPKAWFDILKVQARDASAYGEEVTPSRIVRYALRRYMVEQGWIGKESGEAQPYFAGDPLPKNPDDIVVGWWKDKVVMPDDPNATGLNVERGTHRASESTSASRPKLMSALPYPHVHPCFLSEEEKHRQCLRCCICGKK